MKNTIIKKISFAMALSLCVATSGQAFSIKAQTITQPSVNQIEVKDFKGLNYKVSQSITVTSSKVIFDQTKASQVGLSQEQIQKLQNTYDQINEGIKNKSISIIIRNGNYDISPNSNELTKYSKLGTATISSNVFYFYINASDCSDAAAILAGGAAGTASIAGVLGLTGIGLPVAAALTVASGIMGMGSSYLWYCSNHGGITGWYNLSNGNFYFHKLY